MKAEPYKDHINSVSQYTMDLYLGGFQISVLNLGLRVLRCLHFKEISLLHLMVSLSVFSSKSQENL